MRTGFPCQEDGYIESYLRWSFNFSAQWEYYECKWASCFYGRFHELVLHYTSGRHFDCIDITDSNTVLSQQPALSFVPSVASATTSTMMISPAAVVANGVSTANVTVTLRDSNGVLVPNKEVSLSTTGLPSGVVSISPPAQVTSGEWLLLRSPQRWSDRLFFMRMIVLTILH